jgi:hypothetical protein
MLTLNTERGHVPHLHDHHPNNKITFKPPNTTALVQPMDRGDIVSFVADYLQQISERFIEAVDNENGSALKELWKF